MVPGNVCCYGTVLAPADNDRKGSLTSKERALVSWRIGE